MSNNNSSTKALTSKSSEHPTKSQHKSHKRITESQHESIKRAIIKREEDNYDKIYLVPCSGDQGWYEISEHSALIYYYEVIVPLGLSTRLHEDTVSFYTHYKYGSIRTNSPATIKDNLVAQNLFESEQIDRDVIIYHLAKTFTAEDINSYAKQIHTSRIANASIVKSDNAAPEYYIIVSSFAKNILYACSNKMNEIERNSFASKIINYAVDLSRIYLEINYLDRRAKANDIITKWDKIIDITYYILIEMHLMRGLGIWAPEVIIRYSDQILRARVIARKEIAKLKKEIKIPPQKSSSPKSTTTSNPNNQKGIH